MSNNSPKFPGVHRQNQVTVDAMGNVSQWLDGIAATDPLGELAMAGGSFRSSSRSGGSSGGCGGSSCCSQCHYVNVLVATPCCGNDGPGNARSNNSSNWPAVTGTYAPSTSGPSSGGCQDSSIPSYRPPTASSCSQTPAGTENSNCSNYLPASTPPTFYETSGDLYSTSDGSGLQGPGAEACGPNGPPPVPGWTPTYSSYDSYSSPSSSSNAQSPGCAPCPNGPPPVPGWTPTYSSYASYASTQSPPGLWESGSECVPSPTGPTPDPLTGYYNGGQTISSASSGQSQYIDPNATNVSIPAAPPFHNAGIIPGAFAPSPDGTYTSGSGGGPPGPNISTGSGGSSTGTPTTDSYASYSSPTSSSSAQSPGSTPGGAPAGSTPGGTPAGSTPGGAPASSGKQSEGKSPAEKTGDTKSPASSSEYTTSEGSLDSNITPNSPARIDSELSDDVFLAPGETPPAGPPGNNQASSSAGSSPPSSGPSPGGQQVQQPYPGGFGSPGTPPPGITRLPPAAPPQANATFDVSQPRAPGAPQANGTFDVSQPRAPGPPQANGTFNVSQPRAPGPPQANGTFNVSQPRAPGPPQANGTFNVSQPRAPPCPQGTFNVSQPRAPPCPQGTFHVPQPRAPCPPPQAQCTYNVSQPQAPCPPPQAQGTFQVAQPVVPNWMHFRPSPSPYRDPNNTSVSIGRATPLYGHSGIGAYAPSFEAPGSYHPRQSTPYGYYSPSSSCSSSSGPSPPPAPPPPPHPYSPSSSGSPPNDPSVGSSSSSDSPKPPKFTLKFVVKTPESAAPSNTTTPSPNPTLSPAGSSPAGIPSPAGPCPVSPPRYARYSPPSYFDPNSSFYPPSPPRYRSPVPANFQPQVMSPQGQFQTPPDLACACSNYQPPSNSPFGPPAFQSTPSGPSPYGPSFGSPGSQCSPSYSYNDQQAGYYNGGQTFSSGSSGQSYIDPNATNVSIPMAPPLYNAGIIPGAYCPSPDGTYNSGSGSPPGPNASTGSAGSGDGSLQG